MDILTRLPALVLLERIPVPSLAMARDGIILFANTAFAEMVGYGRTAYRGWRSLRSSIPVPAAVCALSGVDALANLVVELRHCEGWTVRARMSKSALMRRDDPVVLVTFEFDGAAVDGRAVVFPRLDPVIPPEAHSSARSVRWPPLTRSPGRPLTVVPRDERGPGLLKTRAPDAGLVNPPALRACLVSSLWGRSGRGVCRLALATAAPTWCADPPGCRLSAQNFRVVRSLFSGLYPESTHTYGCHIKT